MEVFKIETAYDELGNSPWDTLWYHGDDEDLDALDCQMRLAPIWRPPSIQSEKRHQVPDIYQFQSRFATTKRVYQLLSPLVGDNAEFLPLRLPGPKRLFVIHPLLRVELDAAADVSRNGVSGNVTVIRRYSFTTTQFEQTMHLFQVNQALGSAARESGYPCSVVLVSRQFRDLCEQHCFRGVFFRKVWAD
jgi:hypothetical protein